MPKFSIEKEFSSEQALAGYAAAVAQCWQNAGCDHLVVALQGDLGSGKTSWVRAMLRGLGYRGRVPSPTYTLLEHYRVADLNVVHMDLYRIQAGEEVENLGVRDWLQSDSVWLLAEWPERTPLLNARSDLRVTLQILDESSRRVTLTALTEPGNRALRASSEKDSNYGT